MFNISSVIIKITLLQKKELTIRVLFCKFYNYQLYCKKINLNRLNPFQFYKIKNAIENLTSHLYILYKTSSVLMHTLF